MIPSMTYGAYKEDRDRAERYARRYEEEKAAEAARRSEPQVHPLIKLAVILLAGLVMWVIFGRIGGHPFPH